LSLELSAIEDAAARNAAVVDDPCMQPRFNAGAANGFDDFSDGLGRPNAIRAWRALAEYLSNLLVPDVGAVSVGEGEPCICDPLLEMIAVDCSVISTSRDGVPVGQDPPSVLR
jgi:hypothetical protein